MDIQIKDIVNNELNENDININIEHTEKNDIKELVEYIKEYDTKKILVRQYNEYKQINYKDIILFYSDKRDVYCKTINGEDKVKNTLYELEKEKDFMRISRNCIINTNHLESFDIGETGKLVVKLDDGTEEIVSRRKVKEIMKYIEERSI